jgi:hypothetical protein
MRHGTCKGHAAVVWCLHTAPALVAGVHQWHSLRGDCGPGHMLEESMLLAHMVWTGVVPALRRARRTDPLWRQGCTQF